ncbi:hypothetical protein MMC07_007385 [Pseudocyphellaria aurata]|nr:hypothetical protein [Pseudocyphellaria aurata]
MAAQAALIAETIAGMKRTISGHEYSSDSDDSFHYSTNRGNKLKRKAHYVHEGQLDRPNGPKVYKRKIEHAGYERYIISRNPKRYDEDGDELDDDEVDEQADADAAARNPYNEIHLEEILAPLPSAADLPNHISLSVPYISKTLSDMVQQAREMLHREKKTLWNVKQLLTKLRGDETWIPCGNITSEVDNVIFDTESIYNEIVKTRLHTNSNEYVGQRLPNGKSTTLASIQRGSISGVGAIGAEAIPNGIPTNVDTKSYPIAEPEVKVDPLDSTKSILDTSEGVPGEEFNHSTPEKQHANVKAAQEVVTLADQGSGNSAGRENMPVDEIQPVESDHDAAVSKDIQTKQEDPTIAGTPQQPSGDQDQVEPESVKAIIESTSERELAPSDQDPCLEAEVKDQGSRGGEDEDDSLQPPPRRMTTRAQALATSENNTTSSRTRSASPVSWVPPAIHPLYLMPPSARPDRNFGLPPGEAEDIRRMVMLYVQKQEEVCRGAEKLYVGLLRADRMRKTVFKWCKAEAHVGEMSDGEDWYDKEEWGLDEELRKGHDDEEDDAVTQGKKTRGRRA